MDFLPQHHWRSLVWMMKRAEMSFRAFANHAVLSHIYHAKSPFQDIHAYWWSVLYVFIWFFWWHSIWYKCFSPLHTDADFMMSISQVFLKGKDVYHLDNDIISYFCFPTLGVAVPLRPGDYFMFNALIPHRISSRCRLEDDVMCAFVYLKSAIVGMNNNNLLLTPKQSATMKQLNTSKIK